MAQESQCRFCLASKISQTNPLISPCQCKGTVEFVHLKCLNRWRRMDIARNGRQCSLCLTNYIIPQLNTFEKIPEINTIRLYYLQYPGLILSLYNYIYVVLLSSNKNPLMIIVLSDTYIVSQYCFHILYILFFISEWRVNQRRHYWVYIKKPLVFFLIGCHIYLFYLLHQQSFLVGPILSFVMGFYWHCHLCFLQNINESLEIEEN